MVTELFPSQTIINSVITKVIEPSVEIMAKDASRKFSAPILVIVNAERHQQKNEVSSSNDAPSCVGEIRIRFRDSAREGRILFHAEAIFDKATTAANFSGFMMKGEIIVNGENIVVARKAFSVRYSVWEWAGWL